MEKISIIYSHTPFWRAEVLRVSLYLGNINFEDIRITRDEFREVILTGKITTWSKFKTTYQIDIDKV